MSTEKVTFDAQYIITLPTASKQVYGSMSLEGMKAKAGETVHPWPASDYAIIPWPMSIRWDTPLPMKVSPTKGSYALHARRGEKPRFRTFTISGDVYYHPSLPAAESAQAGADGFGEFDIDPAYALLEKAVALIEEACRLGVAMNLYAIEEAVFVEAVPVRVTRGRAKDSTRTGQHYDLVFRTVGTIQEPKIDVLGAVAPTAKKLAISDVTKALQTASAKITAATDWVKRKNPVMSGISDVMSAGEAAVDVVDTAATSISRVKNAPYEAMLRCRAMGTRLVSTWEVFKTSMTTWLYASPPGARPGDDLVAYLDADDVVDDAARTSLVSALGAQNVTSSGMQQTVTAFIRASDTLQSIAAAKLGNAARADEIATLNGLQPPYLSTSGEPGTKKPGDKLLLPGDAPPSQTFGGLADTDEERLYGRDLAVDANFDLAVVGPVDAADWGQVSGVACYAQSQTIRTRTRRGTNQAWPDMGLEYALGSVASEESTAAFAVSALYELRSDDRVARVSQFKVVDEGDHMGIKASVHLRNSENVQVG